MVTIAARARRGIVPAVLVGLVLAALVAVGCWRLGEPFDYDYDEGVYLVSARLLLHGKSLFGEVFSSQPPLFLDLLHGVFRVFGDTIAAGRALSLVFAVVACGMVAELAWELIDPWAGPVAALVTASSIVFLVEARSVQAEMVSLGFALAAMVAIAAPDRARRWGWQLGAGIAFGCALATKLYVAPWAVGLALLALRGAPMRVRALAMVGVTSALTFVGICAVHGLGEVYAQAFGFHVAALGLDVVGPNSDMIWNVLSGEVMLVPLGLGGLAALIWRRRPGWYVVLGWLAASLAFVAWYAPLFNHHLVLVVPPLAVAASALVVAVPAGRTRVGVVAVVAALVMIKCDRRAVSPSIGFGPTIVASRLFPALDPDDARVAAAIAAHTAPTDQVVTDQQILAFLAGRDVPPMLCDTSFVRIRAGSLVPEAALRAMAEARVLFLGSGRLVELSGFGAWLRAHGQPIELMPTAKLPTRGLYRIEAGR
jgi:Dolichyl-phosphate-mannose-protein mannosyltransferase